MSLDFNPHIMFNLHNAHNQKIIKNQIFENSVKPDTFTKTINVQNNSTIENYDNIKITKKDFGTIEKTGEKATLYTITNKNGASVDLSTFGATIIGIKVPDKDGKLTDVTQGYDNVTPYEKSPVGHAGGTIGPYANKINNGEFELNGKTYKLYCNKDNGKTHSHGGIDGFDVKNWSAKELPDGVEFTYFKKDMENGYPANVETKVTYKFDNDNKLHIKFSATTDADTILNLTNHTYFNLDGAHNTLENSVLDHIVTLPNSSNITVNNEIAVPTGEIRPVKDTPFDFSTPHKIGDVINSEDAQIKIGAGFDQNYVVDDYDGTKLIEVADVKSEKTGINLKVSTNLPGFQFYTANHLGKSTQPNGKLGSRYEKRSAFCVEPQIFPNAINTPNFKEKGILRNGEIFNKEIIYAFSIDKN